MDRDEAFWRLFDPRSPLYSAEAEDYVARLLGAVAIPPSARVLDFGCGFGLGAVLLAPHAGEIHLWDRSPQMRTHARDHCAGRANLRVLAAPPAAADGLYDLILVHSVLQYIDDEGVRALLASLAQLVAAGGAIVISDVVTDESSTTREIFQLLGFGLRRRILAHQLRELGSTAQRYAAVGRARPMRRWSRPELRALAEEASLTAELLPANLTWRTRRLAAVMRPSAGR